MRRTAARLSPLTLAAVLVLLSAPVEAQIGRVYGIVRDAASGSPLRGATVTADNPQASPGSFSAVTDDKGRFSLIGLKAGIWIFTAYIRDYVPQRGASRVLVLGNNAPLEFRLEKAPPVPPSPFADVDVKALQQELTTAEQFMAGGRYEEAVASYVAVREKLPALTMVDLQIGRAYRLSKDYPHAVDTLDRLLERDASNAMAKLERGLIELDRGDLDAADRILSEAVAGAAPGRDVLFALGEVKFAQARPDEASTWYRRAAEADPTWAAPHLKLGLVAVNAGDQAAAIAHLEKVISLQPGSTEAERARQLLDQLKR